MKARARKILVIYPNDLTVVMITLEAERPSLLLVWTAINSPDNTSALLQLAVEQDVTDLLPREIPLRKQFVH
jgi:hypothetical protein